MVVRKGNGLFLFMLVLGFSTLGLSQVVTSSIVGHVTDASGAAVPDAQVVITNQGTGIQVKTSTGSAGDYTVTDLYAGVYQIQVTKAGFRVVQIASIDVLASQTVRQDVELAVGSAQQSVTVISQTPLVNTDSGDVGGVLTSNQLDNLPTAQQSISTLIELAPGGIGGSGSNPQLGGSAYWGGTDFLLNGLNTNDFTNGRGLIGYGLGLVGEPPTSSMQEFKVDVSSMDAEYAMQANVQMVTKQGTNKFHGEAYEYNTNSALAANVLTLNAAGEPKPPNNLNQFGGNVGGPIWKNKAFFFFNFSGFRDRTYSPVQLNFPSAAMRSGDFGALLTAAGGNTQLYNPLTGAAFSGDVIPQSMLTSQASALNVYLPEPTNNEPGLPNEAPDYVSTVAVPRDFDIYDLRLDYQLSAKDSVTGFFNHHTDLPWFSASGTTPQAYGNGSNYGANVVIYQLAEEHTFGPTTFNAFRLGWENEPQHDDGQNLNFDPTSLFPQQATSAQRGLPDMTFLDYGSIGDTGYRNLSSYAPTLTIMDDLTHVHGRHTLKAGAYVSVIDWFQESAYAHLPGFTFNGEWTGDKGNPGQPQSQGNDFADYLLGDANTSETGTVGHDNKFYNKDWELYFQDTWQATHRLTVYIGVRVMNTTPWIVRNDLQGAWIQSSNKLVVPENSPTPTLEYGMAPQIYNAFLPYIETSQAAGLPLHMWPNNYNNWGPRFGLAFRPFNNGKTVLRGGYGIYYAPNCSACSPLDSTTVPRFSGASSSNSASLETFTTQLPGSPTSQFLPDITFSNPFPSSNGGLQAASSHPVLFPMQLNYKLPRTQSWNLTVERQLSASDMVRISYVGSQTQHDVWYEVPIDVPEYQIPNESEQAQLPIQPWGGIDADLSGGKQNYNQLQLEYTRRMARGLGAQVEYAFTRALSDDEVGYAWPGQYEWNTKAAYGNSSYFPNQRLEFNYIYSLPVGKGRQFISDAHGVLDAVLGGWQVAGITIYSTGLPLTGMDFQPPSSYVGWWGGLANRVSGVSMYDKQSGHNITAGVQWLNLAAFTPPQPWQWGNSQAYAFDGPGSSDWDMSAQKYFGIPIRGLESPRLQLRVDFFDAFNHFNLGNPDTTIADTQNGGLPIPTAGKIYTGSNNRTIQVGLKFEF